MKRFLAYTVHVFGRWRASFAMMTFLLTIPAILSGQGIQIALPYWCWLVILLLSLYVGTFLAYRDVIESRPTGAALQLHLQDTRFSGSGWQTVFPHRPLKLTLRIEAQNRGQEKAWVQTLEFSQCELNTPMFKLTNDVKLYHSSASSPMVLPFDVPGRDRLNFVMEREIDLTEHDPETFVRRVKGLTNLRFELLYRSVDIDGNRKEDTLSETVSYEEFRNAVLSNLIHRKNHHLVYILKDIQPY